MVPFIVLVVGLVGWVTSRPPHVVFMLTDDLGWNSMWHNPDHITPTLDSLAKESLELTSHYVYKYCAPTRASLLTGRFPFKLAATRNNLNPGTIPEGTHLGYTMLPEKLLSASPPYVSHQVGKWHSGFFTEHYTPVGRGFATSYGFLEGGEDHYTQHNGNCHGTPNVDLYNSTVPAWGRNGTYNGYSFTERAVNIIQQHPKNQPLFLYFALHNTHMPNESPKRFSQQYHFDHKKFPKENVFNGMCSVVDESVKNVTEALKATNMWKDTLFIWTTDNGAPCNEGGAGSNHPLRGAKGYNWEGGVRTPAIITGGVLPDNMRGQQKNGLVAVADWYATICHLAGVNPKDINPNSPSPIDSLNQWSYFIGQSNTSIRTEVIHDHRMFTNVTQGAIRIGDWKLIVAQEHAATWYGNFSPNSTGNDNYKTTACDVDKPCLFNIKEDWTEHYDVADKHPEIVSALMKRFTALEGEYHPPKDHPPAEEAAFCAAVHANKGFVVPWHTTTP